MALGEMIVAINRPIEDVFAFVADGTTTPRWQSEVVAARQTSAGAVGVGTTYRSVRTQSREKIEATVEITEYEVNKRVSFAWTLCPDADADAGARVGSYIFRSVGAGTWVTFAFETGPKMRTGRFQCQREAMDLSALKALMEIDNIAEIRAMSC